MTEPRPFISTRRLLAGVVATGTAFATALAPVTPAAAAAGDPFGAYDHVSSPAPGKIFVRGWVADPDVPTESIMAQAQFGNTGYSFSANTSRPDVGAVYPGYGDNHGFDHTIETNRYGNIDVKVYAVNKYGTPGSSIVDLGTRTVRVAPASPVGALESVTSPRPGVLKVRGWGFDPNRTTQTMKLTIDLYKYTKGRQIRQTFRIRADKVRRDIARDHNTGKRHGFEATFATNLTGQIAVVATGTNVHNTPGRNYEIGRAYPKLRNHTGSPEGWASAIPSYGRVVVWGAAWDPSDYTRPVLMRTLITKGTAREQHDYWASNVDHQVGRYLRGTADRHAFRQAWATRFRGDVRVRTYAFNRTGTGRTTLLRDRTIRVE